MTLDISQVLTKTKGEKVSVQGWVSSKSSIGGISFLILRDGSGYIQIAGKKGVASDLSLDKMIKISVESAVRVSGNIREETRAPGGVEISVEEFQTIAKADKWPITKSASASSSFLFDNRHLSIRGRKSSAIIKIRSEIINSAFSFFTGKGFYLISAPSLVKNSVEGGSTLFEVDYFGDTAYLSQSAQLYEEAAICSLEKVFIFQPAFRAEKSKTTKHLTEFWMIEAEVAFQNQEDNLKLQEDFVSHIIEEINNKKSNELKILGRKINNVNTPFPRIKYDEARELAIKKNISFEWGEDIPTKAEKEIAKEFDTPFFITGYPLSARSFYHMTEKTNNKVTLSADLFAPEGYGELLTGGQRIHDYSDLKTRIKENDLSEEIFKWYLDLRRFGLPYHSGFGVGVERLTRWICGVNHIRSTSLFPRTLSRITP